MSIKTFAELVQRMIDARRKHAGNARPTKEASLKKTFENLEKKVAIEIDGILNQQELPFEAGIPANQEASQL